MAKNVTIAGASYSDVPAVDLPQTGGGGASSWTKVAETTYQVTHGSTSEANVDTFETGHSEIWDSGKIVYVRIRDTEGPRNGYFFEANSFFFVPPGSTQNSTFAFCSKSVNNSGGFDLYTSGVGVFAKTIYSDGDVLIRKKYLGNNTRTIDSTYKVEVYLLDPAGGISPFA